MDTIVSITARSARACVRCPDWTRDSLASLSTDEIESVAAPVGGLFLFKLFPLAERYAAIGSEINLGAIGKEPDGLPWMEFACSLTGSILTQCTWRRPRRRDARLLCTLHPGPDRRRKGAVRIHPALHSHLR